MALAVFAIVTLFNVFNGGKIQIDPNTVLNGLQNVQVGQQDQPQAAEFAGKDDYETFASTVLGSINDTWSGIFEQKNKSYAAPKLVLFRDYTNSACGGASSAMGPHYCPNDQTIYLDETFFDELQSRFGGSNGDVAQAYVLAHEVGHHVQNQLGIMRAIEKAQGTSSQNRVSVQLELQADCFAGVWANSIRKIGVFEGPNEIQEAIDAAASVGDDRIQEKMQGSIDPESWTHGSSRERVDWFSRGYQAGQPAACSTL